jgi:hypothetical protein
MQNKFLLILLTTSIITLAATFIFINKRSIPFNRKANVNNNQTTIKTEVSEKSNNTCETSNDCELWMCAGCVNKEWAETAPPDLPCANFADYSDCECMNDKCVEVK